MALHEAYIISKNIKCILTVYIFDYSTTYYGQGKSQSPPYCFLSNLQIHNEEKIRKDL